MRRALLAPALLSAALLAHPAGAAAPGLHLTDPVGDANGVNGQGTGLPVPSTSTPASLKGADVVALDVVNVFKGKGKKRKPAGFTVRARFSAPLQQGVNVTATMDASSPCGDTSRIQLGYQDTGVLVTDLAICQAADSGTGSSTDVGVTEVSADKTTITWTIDNVLPARAVLSNITISTSVFVLGVFDELTTDRTFVYGA